MAEQNYTISDIIETYISGDWGNDEPSEDASCPVSCIRGADIVPIYNSEYNNIPLRYISEKSLSNRALQEGDIVIEKSGGSPTQSTGRVVYISKELLEEKLDIVCSNFCAAFRIKPEWDAKYVYYYLQHVYNAGVFFNFEGKTSGLKNLIMDTAFKSITIKKIAIETQRSIATVLSTIESKMAANSAINHYLEAMAKQLYDYWFVQFDFPDENGNPYKSSGGKMVWNEKLKREIPDGWELTPLFEGVDVQYGFPFSTDLFTEIRTEIPIVRIRDIMDGSTSAFYCGEVDDKYRLNKGDIVIGMDGNFHMNYWHSDVDYLNQRCVRLRPKSNSQISALQSLFETSPYIKAKENSAKGSTVGHLSDKDLKGMWLIKPMSNVNFKPREIFDSLLNQMIRHKEELLHLTQCRNELLPLLMTGQVSVKQLNNDLENN